MALDIDVLFEPEVVRARRAAARLKRLKDVQLPRLEHWNYDPCRFHDKPDPVCEYRMCGGEPFGYQRVAITWLYAARKGIIGDVTGLGKTVEVLGLLALLKERGELGRGIIVAQNGAVEDPWLLDTRRFAPGLLAVPGVGTRAERRALYASEAWDVLVIGYMMFLRDYEVLRHMDWTIAITDDVQPMLHPKTETALRFNTLAEASERVVNLNATPLNLNLLDLYAMSLSCGGYADFGSEREFTDRHIRIEHIKALSPSGKVTIKPKITGYKNMREFKSKFGPYFLRRDYDDVEGDVAIPDVAPPENVWLELHPRQRDEYSHLQTGLVRRLLAEGEHVKRVSALTAFGYGAQICSGLTNLGHEDVRGETSVKLDWFENKITGEWAAEKVVVFSQYKGTIRAMHARLAEHDIDCALIWGDTPGDSKRKMALRKEEQRRFWQDPRCRVAVGTTAIERSLNFQNARIVVNLDLLLNPQRMVQILGRIRRVGSKHKRVYPVNLLTKDSQEERYLPILSKRAAVADYVFEGKNPLFHQLDPVELLHLIQP